MNLVIIANDFNLLAKTLQHNLAIRRQWIADISHELRTPVAILQGEIEAIQDGVRQITEERLSSIHQETLRLSRLINDLHELAITDLGALSYQKSPINIIQVI